MPSPSYVNSVSHSYSTSGTGGTDYNFTVAISWSATSPNFVFLGQISDISQAICSIVSIADDGGNTWTRVSAWGIGNNQPDVWRITAGFHSTTTITLTMHMQGTYIGVPFVVNGAVVIGEYANFTEQSIANTATANGVEVNLSGSSEYIVGFALQSNNAAFNHFTGPDIGGIVRQTFSTDGFNFGVPIYFADVCLIDDLSSTGVISQTVGTNTGTLLNGGLFAFGFIQTSPPPSTGNILIQKVTMPSGSAQVFTFSPSYGSPFTLIDGHSNLSAALSPAVYAVTESPQTGWTTTTSSDPAHITVTAANITTVTFTNTTSNIVIQKVTVPSSSTQQFTFTTTYGAPFILTNGGSNNSGPLTPGVYAVTELPMVGWSIAASQDPLHITTTAGPLTVTFTNTLFPVQGGGSGPGGNPNVYFDYNVNQQCWNLPGILQMPVCTALGSIETSPGVWRLLVDSNVYDNTSGTPVFVQSTLAYRDINNFQDLGSNYAPVAVFGSIQLADPGSLAKFGGRGGLVFEYTNAGTAPAVSVLPNDIGCDLTKAVGAQVVGNFVNIPNPLTSPPTLGNQPVNYRSLTYYWLKAKALSAFLRHFQFMLQAPAENQPTELIGFGIFGDEKQESEAPGQIPTLQGR